MLQVIGQGWIEVGMFERALDDVNEAIMMVDGYLKIAYVNGRSERMFDFKRDEVLGRKMTDVINIPEVTRYIQWTLAHHQESTSGTMEVEWKGKLRHLCVRIKSMELSVGIQGATCFFEDRTEQVTLNDEWNYETHKFNRKFISLYMKDQYYGHVWVNRDISHRKQAEMKVEQARQDAIRANQAKNRFLSQMSHELRTPLNSIVGFSQILLDSDDHSLMMTHKSKLKRILNAGVHLSSLIKDMLDFSLIEVGDIQLDLKPERLKPILSDCVRSMQNEAEEREMELILLPSDDKLSIECDAVRFKQVMLNLISNGLKYNTPKGTVTVRAVEERDGIKVLVRDTGLGISKDLQTRIFSPLFRSSSHKEIEGTGLGLSIVAALTKKMGGDYGVESEEGVGSTFWVTFPKSQVPSERIDRTQEADADGEAPGKCKVLYIEDNPDNLLLVKEIVKYSGMNIDLIHSQDGLSGLRAVDEHRVDLILLDMNLPDMSGEDVLKTLKEAQHTCDIPVIVLSANALREQKERAYALGCCEYITKPLDIKFFIETLQENLKHNGWE
ncbi:ATP-binding protein [Peribacillus acanthi]|uniref:ATP-binding protein n=1 Tax=Peribacillus acanthi TaxID=2171554 RepID=UPI0014736E49|nr:ATP-binding protein [Peribacillus acanthi]